MSPSDPTTASAINLDVAERFREAADLLEAQDASPFRVRAYRQGASTLTQLDRSVEAIYEEEGREGLEALPNIGSALTNAIVETLQTGQWRFLERLRGRVTPESVFRQVAGIGPELAERIHDALGVDTLEELEQAAHDGRLAEVEGIGERRLQAVRESVESRLRARRREGADVPVAELLDVDREYRRKAERGRLRRIAPRRFNPEGEAWLPILHTDRDGRHYTALYSNTARAHELDKTDDWVVLYLEDDRQAQWTVVTETAGDLKGRRVVRGREADCRAYYDAADDA
jgi:DNA uptake protein ComE-like DNA-binding protein